MKINRRGFLKSLSAVPLAIALNKVDANQTLPATKDIEIKVPSNISPPINEKPLKQVSASAWVNFDGSKNPPEILGSHGVSEVRVNPNGNAGEYIIEFENPIKIATDHNVVAVIEKKSENIIQATKNNDVVGLIEYS